jgi:hypothetical protein
VMQAALGKARVLRFFVKPCDPRELAKVIRDALQHRGETTRPAAAPLAHQPPVSGASPTVT